MYIKSFIPPLSALNFIFKNTLLKIATDKYFFKIAGSNALDGLTRSNTIRIELLVEQFVTHAMQFNFIYLAAPPLWLAVYKSIFITELIGREQVLSG